jgi:hypothetical protein
MFTLFTHKTPFYPVSVNSTAIYIFLHIYHFMVDGGCSAPVFSRLCAPYMRFSGKFRQSGDIYALFGQNQGKSGGLSLNMDRCCTDMDKSFFFYEACGQKSRYIRKFVKKN